MHSSSVTLVNRNPIAVFHPPSMPLSCALKSSGMTHGTLGARHDQVVPGRAFRHRSHQLAAAQQGHGVHRARARRVRPARPAAAARRPLELQVPAPRARASTRRRPTFDKYVFLRDLQDTNETLFYALLARNIEEMLPIVYTPTVGEGCQRFSQILPQAARPVPQLPEQGSHRADPRPTRATTTSKCIVVSDGERILGLGDQGAGGMGIPIGKLSLYTALRRHPSRSTPADPARRRHRQRRSCSSDPLYIGWRHERVRGAGLRRRSSRHSCRRSSERWPNVLLQWEDFAGANADALARALSRPALHVQRRHPGHRGGRVPARCSSAINVTGVPLADQRIVDRRRRQRAGCGIANADARS